MTNLTANQISQLQSNGVYSERPVHPLFTMADLLAGERTEAILHAVQTISGSPNKTVAASYLMRRYGMFTGMQLVQYVLYDEFWNGRPDEFRFGAADEYGNRTVSTYPAISGWVEADPEQPRAAVRKLLEEIDQVIGSLRKGAPISANVLWENVFGFWLWHFHVMLDDPSSEEQARTVLELVKSDDVWAGIHDVCRFRLYLNGRDPSQLLNTTVRTTCCLSKDVPGLMQCGFCPLKKG